MTVPFAGTHAGGPSEWTEEEVHRLIEGIELHGDNWDNVAQHVGGRAPAECVIQFIRLPIDADHIGPDGNYIKPVVDSRSLQPDDDVVMVDGNRTETTTLTSPACTIIPTPSSACVGGNSLFKESENPLLAQIDFINSILGSECAAMSSRAAAQSMLENRKPINASSGDCENQLSSERLESMNGISSSGNNNRSVVDPSLVTPEDLGRPVTEDEIQVCV